MLSKQELQNIQRALANNPSKSAERKLRNKLIEHGYASKYPPFSPLPHHQQFLNKKTSEQVLHQLIDAAKISEIILLDTESVTIYRQPNRPELIQLQLIPNDAVPIVVIVEVYHLPPTNSNEFKLMQEFFRIVLDSDKVIYTWGTIDELTPFTTFNLFNTKQIYSPENENLQEIFKGYWQLCHKHRTTVDCNCEDCLGKKSDQPWKLLDAVAHQLNEWLDKRRTCSPFNIGLDPRLRRLSTEQLEYRTILTNYAANDVLSMEKIMIDMQERPPPTSTNHPENVSETQKEISTNTIDETPIVLLLHPSSPVSITEQQPIPDQQTDQQQYHHHRTKKENKHQHEKVNRQHQWEEEQNNYTSKQHETNLQDEQEGINRQQNKRNRTDYQYQREEINHHHSNKRNRTDRQHERQETNRQQERQGTDRQHERQETNRQQERQGTDRQHERQETNRQQERQGTDRQHERQGTDRQHEQNRIEQQEHKDYIERKQKNRISTIKQRQRHFRHEIIRRGIDPRFSVTIVKEILRRYEIPYKAVIISKSKLTRRTSLYIGIRNPSKIRKYEIQTRNLFTTDYYNEFRARHRFKR